MLSRLKAVVRVLTLALVAAGATSAAASRGGVPTVVAQRYYPEVRLRKMHLVRPDLIPYPISFDVYC